MKSWRQNARLHLAALAVSAVFCGLGVRLAFLHIWPDATLRERVRRTRHMEQTIVSGRGRILDRNGAPLAMDLSMKNVCADPKVIMENGYVDFTARHLSRILEVDPVFVRGRLQRPGRRFEYIRKFVPEELAEQVERLQIRGVFFEETSKRHYPYRDLMCHVVGFANMEGVGSGGVEQRLDRYLRGSPGLRVGERDGRRSEIYNRRVVDISPVEGADVYLTLDMRIQHMLQRALGRAVDEHNAKGGWGIIQRVRTGEILAMASFPAFDLNEFGQTSEEQRRNRNINLVYEPGSTFKIAVIAAAFNEGLIRPDQVFDCENGSWEYNRRRLRDYHPYGLLTVADIVRKSSNIGTAKIALLLGEQRVERYLRDFGFGNPTGIDLPGEEGGIVHPVRRWSNISITRIAMGHEVAVTALQMVNAMSAIANDGFLMRPQVISRVTDARGRVLYEAEPEVLSRPVGRDTARIMRTLLEGAVREGGTGRRAAIEGYRVAGKTGTAQKPIPGGYSDDLNIASFTGFFPVEDPEVSMIIVVDEPLPQRTGGAVTAPVFAEIGQELVRYLATRPGEWSGAGRMAMPRKADPDDSVFAFVDNL